MTTETPSQTTRPRVAIFEQFGRMLEKFQLDGSDWVSLVDGRRLTNGQMAALGWVYFSDVGGA